jgi:acetoacetate decarboxylase
MTHSQAPWSLRGFAIQTLQPVDVELVRTQVPSDLEIVSIFPGKTLAGLYLASYGTIAVPQSHELIVINGLVRHQHKVGIWISDVYSDRPDAITAGELIGTSPKQIAQFQWEQGRSPCVEVSHNEQMLCRIRYGWQIPGMWQQMPFTGFSPSNIGLTTFEGKTESYPHLLLNAKLEVPSSSPFSSIGLDQAWLCFYLRQLQLTIRQLTIPGMAIAHQ